MIRWLTLAGAAAILASVLVLECWSPDGAPEIAAPRPVTPPEAAAAEPDAALLSNVEPRLLNRPLFSPERRPATTAPAADETITADLPRLAGVIVGPTRRSAIFADSAGHPHIASEGGGIGRFTVRTIAPGQVTVSSPEGESVLRPSYAGVKAPQSVPPFAAPARGGGR